MFWGRKFKGKFHPITCPEVTDGVEVKLYYFFNHDTRLWLVVNATFRPLYLLERPGTHCIGGWVVPRDGLDE
jgi:hypothetical protein